MVSLRSMPPTPSPPGAPVRTPALLAGGRIPFPLKNHSSDFRFSLTDRPWAGKWACCRPQQSFPLLAKKKERMHTGIGNY